MKVVKPYPFAKLVGMDYGVDYYFPATVMDGKGVSLF
jgi:hypothetical protein